LLEESWTIYEDMHDSFYKAYVADYLGVAYRFTGKPDYGVQLLRQSLELRRMIGDKLGIAESIGRLGFILGQEGQFRAAEPYAAEMLAIYREVGSRTRIAGGLAILASLALYLGEFEKAKALAEDALTEMTALGDLAEIGWTLALLG